MKQNTSTCLGFALLACLAAPAAASDYCGDLAKALGVKGEEWRKSPFLVWESKRNKLAELIEAKDYEGLDAFLDGLPAHADWKAAEELYVPTFFQALAATDLPPAWIKARPSSAHAHVARGISHVRAGWAARGTGYANTVTEQGWKVWAREIKSAEAAIDRALSLDPKHVIGHGQRVHLDRCQGTPREGFQKHLQAALAQAPTLYTIHYEAFWYNLPRYHGTWEQALAGVERLRQAHPGHPTTLRIFVQAMQTLAREQSKGQSGVSGLFAKPEVSGAIRELLTGVRKHRPDSRWPARLELQLQSVYPLGQERASELQAELAEKLSATAMYRAAMRALRQRSLAGEARQVALSRLLIAFLRGVPQAREEIERALAGPDLQHPRSPKGAYAFYRVVGGQSPYARFQDAERSRASAIEALRGGIGVEADEAAAVAEHLEQAKIGNADCALIIAHLTAGGHCELQKDPAAARVWLYKSAELGNLNAIVDLAQAKLYGKAWQIKQDLDGAETWIRKLEELRFREAPTLRKQLKALRAAQGKKP